MRPDIILSDIIMPEKNGYEVCEYVKSHPEYRNIPVILLTGTFEPFDPDRADKAGCDAVVTKPFESQSLIHKVEELIEQSQNAPAEAPEPAALFNDAPAFEPPAVAADPFTHDNDIFAAAPAAEPSFASDMPFDAPSEPAFGGETRAFPRMSFEEMQQMASEPSTAPQPAMPEPVHEPETSPWDETPAAFGGETRAFPRMSFEEMEQMASASQPSFEETPAFHEPPPPPPPAAAEVSPWDEPQQEDNATRAIPAMSFEEMRQMAETSKPAEPPPFETLGAPAEPSHEPDTSPWDEPPAAFGGETRAFPRMSFEEMEQMGGASSSSEPAWAPAADPFAEAPPAESPFAAEEAPEATADTAVNSHVTDDVTPQITDDVNEPITDINTQVTDVNPQITDLTEEQVDRIARRVVQLMSEQVVRNIAWEVIPDLAEMVVKERIRQLEAEA
jgi:hypothetical protein